jgi:hypothetical protein
VITDEKLKIGVSQCLLGKEVDTTAVTNGTGL